MAIELETSSHERSRILSLLWIQSLVGTFISFLQTLWAHLPCPYSPRVVKSCHGSQLLVDCEKEPQKYVDFYQTHKRILAALQCRDAADAEFETQVMALLAPVKMRLAEMNQVVQATQALVALQDVGAAPDLPPAPQIFYGRERELSALVHMFSQGRQAHAALLGLEGAGKSALALALLHHPRVVRNFGARRFFVPCDTSAGILLHLASALGLPQTPSRDAVLSALASSPRDSLIVLDNFYSAPAREDLLVALAAIPRVSLILTLRGGRRPTGPVYTTPLPAPLGALPPSAARVIFQAISDLPGEGDAGASAGAVDTLVRRAGCLPRNIVRLAQRAQYEPLLFLLARCVEEGAL
ncbi:hypothetical protein FB451DRAFT_65851 [Mycena latifolia]|nr:hypothetical protein FB451DRAFT_65851 [Mycena latifolia]